LVWRPDAQDERVDCFVAFARNHRWTENPVLSSPKGTFSASARMRKSSVRNAIA
jgi:hypothetical protein